MCLTTSFFVFCCFWAWVIYYSRFETSCCDNQKLLNDHSRSNHHILLFLSPPLIFHNMGPGFLVFVPPPMFKHVRIHFLCFFLLFCATSFVYSCSMTLDSRCTWTHRDLFLSSIILWIYTYTFVLLCSPYFFCSFVFVVVV